MDIVDTNLLIYAANSAAVHHTVARDWLSKALSSGTTVGFPWVCVLGFLRIVTNPRVMPRPITVADATAMGELWTTQPNAVLLDPGPRHYSILRSLLVDSGTGGNLTTDAHIAALAVETRSRIITFDRDFARFGVDVVVPGSGA